MSRQDQIIVLDNIRMCLDYQKQMKENYTVIQNRMQSASTSVSGNKWVRYGLIALLNLFLLIPIYGVSAFAIMFFIDIVQQPVLGIVIVVLVDLFLLFLLNRSLIKKVKKDEKKESKKAEKFMHRLQPYLPFLQEKIAYAQQLLEKIYSDFNVKDCFRDLSAVNFVIGELQTDSRATLNSAINKFDRFQREAAIAASDAEIEKSRAASARWEEAQRHKETMAHLHDLQTLETQRLITEQRIADMYYANHF